MNAFDPASFRQEHIARRTRLYGEPVRVPAIVMAEPVVEQAECESETIAPVKVQQDFSSLPGPSRARSVLLAVADEHGVAARDLIGRFRSKPLREARFVLYARLKDEMNWSLPQVGRFCGGRDHTTILHGIRVHRGDAVIVEKKRAAQIAWKEKWKARRQTKQAARGAA